jgi:hypothetical protein
LPSFRSCRRRTSVALRDFHTLAALTSHAFWLLLRDFETFHPHYSTRHRENTSGQHFPSGRVPIATSAADDTRICRSGSHSGRSVPEEDARSLLKQASSSCSFTATTSSPHPLQCGAIRPTTSGAVPASVTRIYTTQHQTIPQARRLPSHPARNLAKTHPPAQTEMAPGANARLANLSAPPLLSVILMRCGNS